MGRSSDVHLARHMPGAPMSVTWCGLIGGHAATVFNYQRADCGKCRRESRKHREGSGS